MYGLQMITRRFKAPPRWFATSSVLGLATAVVLVSSACSSSADDEQQQDASQSQQQSTATAADSSTDDSGSTAASDTESSSSGRVGTVSSAQDAQQEESVADREATSQSDDADSAQDAPAEAQQDDGMGGMEAGMSIGIVEAADYDDLSPRLQLLRDSGYPVYVTDQGYTISLGTPDLSPGPHRVSVVIEGPEGLVETPAMRITVLPDDDPGALKEVIARFAWFPDGVRGIHVATIDFTSAGRWNLILHVPSDDGFTDLGIALDVPADTVAPSVGDAAPPSQSRTLTDVANISDLSTGETPDPGLYLISLADAVAADKPFVVVFASPGFCTNAFCGPQDEVLSEVRNIFGDQANYIHVDLYENPEEVRFGEDPIETPILGEWGLHTNEWTFVVNADGVVVARFEAFAPLDEVEAAVADVLGG